MSTVRGVSRRQFLQGSAALTPLLTAVQAQGGRTAAPATNDGKLRIIAFGAHPDDCEIRIAGTAALWARDGHHVKFVSCTNGDIGHWRMKGKELARRRLAEVRRAAEILGISTHVMDVHDGELEPTMENRRTVARLIRDWKADLVFTHRPNDYHPDHRYTGILVQDAAYMVTVPFFVPETAPLTKNPVFMYYPDGFRKPNPFQPDIVVSIDETIEKKLDALDALESQFYEGGANGSAALIPSDPAGQAARRKAVRDGFRNRSAGPANSYRALLREYYGADRAENIRYAEAFELCEYGARPNREELKRLFPFFPTR